jgi:anti-sigma B factor antagonist
MPLLLDTRVVGEVLVVKCGGRIIAGKEAQSLHDHVHKVIPEIPDIVLQLSETVFVDSCGMGTLVRLLTSARAAGGDLKLCAIPKPVLNTLRITNLHRLFETYESEAEAIAASHQRTHRGKVEPANSEFRILCMNPSPDVLAYLSELLRRAGYKVLTSLNVVDAKILLKAARPKLVILGPQMQSAGERSAQQILKDAAPNIPITVLEEDFSTRDAGEAGTRLLEMVRGLVAGKMSGASD